MCARVCVRACMPAGWRVSGGWKCGYVGVVILLSRGVRLEVLWHSVHIGVVRVACVPVVCPLRGVGGELLCWLCPCVQ